MSMIRLVFLGLTVAPPCRNFGSLAMSAAMTAPWNLHKKA